MTEPLAHSGGHLLSDHLEAVAQLASNFSKAFDNAGEHQRWAYLAGLWHDLGKYRAGFQRYINLADNPDAHIEGKVFGREKTHSAAGALWAIETLQQSFGDRGKLAGRVLAYLIAGHHSGLRNWEEDLNSRLANSDSKAEFSDALGAKPPPHILGMGSFIPDLTRIPGGAKGFALWVRLLFSCLVDADFLDTEAHFDKQKSKHRDGFPSLNQMRKELDAHLSEKILSSPVSAVNKLRTEILRQCQDKAALTPGFFSLTVPTGGGKTLSSLAFALGHAEAHGKRRIIYAIPYTSIIEQTAEVFRDVFKHLGDDVLVEHHSQAEAPNKDETARSRIACENWDAPLIVTTNVQLFESLFAAKTSRCRKLHNIVGSVIILDEAQQLPPAFLQPILDVLKLLVAHYGVSVVLCTATQPALNSTEYFDKAKNLQGLEQVREIIDNPDALYGALKRVDVQLPPDFNTTRTWLETAEQISAEDCVLAIVNTRKDAKELHSLLPEGTLHLSALMCGAHRQEVIGQIKTRLKAKRTGTHTQALRVVSTQLIEAGVDIDFPVVFRAMAGLDSIAQAAGRCNREGALLTLGRVVVFVPPEPSPTGYLRKGIEASMSALAGRFKDPLERPLFSNYFRHFYYSVDLDAKRIVQSLSVDPQTLSVRFRTAAEDFRLIDEKDSATVVVRYEPHREEIDRLLAILTSDGPSRRLLRQLQRYTVNIRLQQAERMLSQGDMSLPIPGLYVLNSADSLYSVVLGLTNGDAIFNPGGFVT